MSSRYLLFFVAAVFVLTAKPLFGQERFLAGLPHGHQINHNNLVFSENGERLLFATTYQEVAHVYDGNNEIGKFLYVHGLAVSPDSKHIAFSAKKETGKLYRMLDRTEAGPFDMVCNSTFSGNSEYLAFQAEINGIWRDAAGKIGTNKINYSSPASMPLMPPIFSPDNVRISAFPMYDKPEKTAHVISLLDMREESRREFDWVSHIAFSADKRVMAYAVGENGKARAVKINIQDNKESLSALYDRILGVALSSDGTHLAFGAEKNGRRFLVVDGRETAAPGFLKSLIVSLDGKSAAYVARKPGKEYLVVDGAEREAYDDVYYPVYAAEGNNVAYVGCREGKCRVCTGENCGREWYDFVENLQFTKDGRHLAVVATSAGGKSIIIFDKDGNIEKRGPLFYDIWAPSFAADGQLGYVALTGQEFWWKELKIK